SSPATATLSGTGVAATGAPKLSVSATSLAFGSVTVGQTKDMTLTLTNTGTAALTVSSFAVSGQVFSVLTSPGLTIQPSASQTVSVRFAPASATTFSSILVIGSNDPASPNTNVNLTGTGVAASSDVTLKVDGGVFDKVFGFGNGQKA